MERNKKTQSFNQKLGSFVRRIDAFGTPVSLTYKNEPCIKSMLGGFFTIIARLAVGIYLMIQCSNVLNRENVIQTTLLKRDLTTDVTETSLTLNNFDFGVRLEYIFYEASPEIQENLDQYVFFQITQNIYTWVKHPQTGASVFSKQKQRAELGSCVNGRLGLVEGSKDFLALKAGYQCPTHVDFRMKGSFAGEQTKFVQFRVGFCNQTDLNVKYPGQSKKCKSLDEQYKVAANLKLYLVVQHSYFDSQDFSDNPMKSYLKPYYLTTRNGSSHYYYMQLSENEAQYNDGMLLGSTTKKKFIETRIDYPVIQEIPTSESTPNGFLAVYLQMDDGYKVVSRQVTTFVDALQATGGFMTVILVVILMIIKGFQKTIYTTSLIKSFYKFQKLKPQLGEDEFLSSDEEDKALEKNAAKVNDLNNDPERPRFKDKYKDHKEKIYFNLFDQINNRRKLIIGLAFAVGNQLKKLCCRKQNKKELYKDLLYRRGIIKIQKELDIRNISKQLKTLKFLSQVMLTKSQRYMISFFKENLLNHKNIKDKFTKKDTAILVKKYLFKTVDNCNTTKLDQRLIKNIDLSEDDVEELTKQLFAQAEENAHKEQKKNQKNGTRRSQTSMSVNYDTKKNRASIQNFQNIEELLSHQSKKVSKLKNLAFDEDVKIEPRQCSSFSLRDTGVVPFEEVKTGRSTKQKFSDFKTKRKSNDMVKTLNL